MDHLHDRCGLHDRQGSTCDLQDEFGTQTLAMRQSAVPRGNFFIVEFGDELLYLSLDGT
jgi:hypothetical protein